MTGSAERDAALKPGSKEIEFKDAADSPPREAGLDSAVRMAGNGPGVAAGTSRRTRQGPAVFT
jgi:hypothetical protein